MASLFCVTAFASENDSVITVQHDSEVIEFTVFEDGWNYAMETANSGKEVYVTLLADWTAKTGQFTDDFFNGAGFDYDTIYFANDVTVTLDLNGFTIDRGLTSPEANGEVMFINDDANVTIKNGTIKGGYSNNGAGGIHIEGANVNLIDLVFSNNRVSNDDGAALQHVDGGELYMKNCIFEGNNCKNEGFDIFGTVFLDGVDKVRIEDCYFSRNEGIDYGAGIYSYDCEDIEIKNSTFENLHANDRGGAIWVTGTPGQKISIIGCKFIGNSAGNWAGAIYGELLELYIYDSEFIGNSADWDGGAIYYTGTNAHQGITESYFYGCTFDGNYAGWDGGAIYCNANIMTTGIHTYGCTFINNRAEGSGGAVCCDPECRFTLSSDENGNPGIVKDNIAGEDGGGLYSDSMNGIPGYFAVAGEVYVSGNVSANGSDDIYATGYRSLDIGDVTSPAGSIGIRYYGSNGGTVAEFDDGVSLSASPFFANNEGFEMTVEVEESYGREYRYLIMTKAVSAAGSIFAEDSFASMISLMALAISVASVCLSVALNKKKTN